jgi:hypothetical protein
MIQCHVDTSRAIDELTIGTEAEVRHAFRKVARERDRRLDMDLWTYQSISV